MVQELSFAFLPSEQQELSSLHYAVAVVPATNIVSFLDLLWNWIAGKEQRVISALAYLIIFLLDDQTPVNVRTIFIQPSPSHCKDCICFDIFRPQESWYLFLVIVLIIKCHQVCLDIIFTGTHLILIIVHYYSELNVYWIKD